MVRVASDVWRTWRNSELDGDIGLLLETSPEAFDLVREAFDRADLADVNGDQLADLLVAPLPGGIAIWVAKCDQLEPVVAGLSSALEGIGLGDAAITTLPIADIGVPLSGLAFLKCEMAVRGVAEFYPQVANVGRPPKVRAWRSDLGELMEVARYLLSWALELPEASPLVGLSTGAPFVRVPRNAVEAIVPSVLGRSDVTVVVNAGARFRIISIPPRDGYVSGTEGTSADGEFDWREALQGLLPLLTSAPAGIRSGQITRGWSWAASRVGMTLHASERQPPMGVPLMAAPRRALDEVHLLDAFGAFMRSAPNEMSQIGDPQWQITTLPDDRILFRHADAEAWFGKSETLVDVREAARQSLQDYLPAA